jgi:hypothetical protein
MMRIAFQLDGAGALDGISGDASYLYANELLNAGLNSY